MEITSFYPMIITSDFEGVKASYEALGFKIAHTITDPGDKDIDRHKTVIMKNDKGFRLAIDADSDINHSVNPNIPNLAIWMNVRDYDGTVETLKQHGYTAFSKEREFEFLKTVSMKAPDGHILVVVYHKRKEKDDWE